VIYLDNNATTAIDPEVLAAIMRCFATGPMNASSQHGVGRQARRQLDAAISTIGGLLGADVDSPAADALILTSGGSESNNLAITGLGDVSAPLVVSSIEHPSVLAVASLMQAEGREVRVLPVCADGDIDLDVADRILATSPTPGLVSVMSANNETGVIQPIAELAKRCRTAAVLLHVDATQSIGKVPFHFADLGIDAATFTAHKFHGPGGIGALWVRSGVAVRPMIFGGEQQYGKRPGTEAVPLVIGMMVALKIAVENLAKNVEKMRALRDQFEADLAAQIADVTFHGKSRARLPMTSCFSLPGVDRQAMLMALDLGGIACSSGSACASGSSRPSHVLEAMGVGEAAINAALRVGFSRFSMEQECRQAVVSMSNVHRRLCQFGGVENLT